MPRSILSRSRQLDGEFVRSDQRDALGEILAIIVASCSRSSGERRSCCAASGGFSIAPPSSPSRTQINILAKYRAACAPDASPRKALCQEKTPRADLRQDFPELIALNKDELPPTLAHGFWSFTMYGADFQPTRDESEETESRHE